jgi:hypothetical protein
VTARRLTPSRLAFAGGLAAGVVASGLVTGTVWTFAGHSAAPTSPSSHPGSPSPGASQGAGSTVPPEPAPVAIPSLTGAPTPGWFAPTGCPAATVTVRDADELTAALAAARPGDSIVLADGVYRGRFVASRSGTPAEPIVLCGGPGAVLDGGGIKKGYALHLAPAQYWRVVGFTVRNAQKGVMADGTTRTVIQRLTVTDIGDEGIHLRAGSTYTTVAGNTISRTGRRNEKFGEGIYIGSAKSNWCEHSACAPDRSDHNTVQGNRISATTAESIDIKEGTTGGVVSGNSFDGTGMIGGDSWVDVKGNGWLIEGNHGVNAPEDGFQTHRIVTGWGTGNVFRNNRADVDGPGYGIHLAPVAANLVACNNAVTRAARGLSNTSCK